MTPPPDFVARREELAAEAKTEGCLEEARLLHAARRPTLAAWAANLLLRSQPGEAQRFLELGRALRESYRTLNTDGIKELSDQRRSMVSTLSRQAATLALEAGHRLSDAAQQDVASTLHAVGPHGCIDRGAGAARAGNTETTRSSTPPGSGPRDRGTTAAHSYQDVFSAGGLFHD